MKPGPESLTQLDWKLSAEYSVLRGLPGCLRSYATMRREASAAIIKGPLSMSSEYTRSGRSMLRVDLRLFSSWRSAEGARGSHSLTVLSQDPVTSAFSCG